MEATQTVAGDPRPAVDPPAGVRGRRRPSSDAGWLWLAVLAFVAVSTWWFAEDDRIPIWDAGSHLVDAYDFGYGLQHGHPFLWFTAYTTYPPLAHLVGSVAYLVGGLHPMAMSVFANVVFVPLLAFGCYGVGRRVAGPRAGLLAGLLALGAPMVVSMFHSFMVDTPQAAMVAVSVWALLACERFERFWTSALAGALAGLAMMTKETSVVFLAGIVAVVVLRGGWRRPGALAYLVAALVIAGPWYGDHWSQITSTFNSIGQLDVSPAQSPPRGSLRNFGWYFWDLVNEQILLPFTVALVIGIFVAIAQLVRGRAGADRSRGILGMRVAPANVLPELLVGGLVSYLGVTYLTHKDPRYSLPALVYVAVIATFWIAALPRRRARLALTAAIVVIAAVNFAGMSFGIGGAGTRVEFALPGAPPPDGLTYPHRFTVYEDQGWLRGPPEHEGNVLALLRGLHRMGIREIAVAPEDGAVDFNMIGMLPLAPEAGLVMESSATGVPDSAYLFQATPQPGEPRPCQEIDGGGVYVVRGAVAGLDPATLRAPANPHRSFAFVCPGRAAVRYPR